MAIRATHIASRRWPSEWQQICYKFKTVPNVCNIERLPALYVLHRAMQCNYTT